jgi:hypothetical protein
MSSCSLDWSSNRNSEGRSMTSSLWISRARCRSLSTSLSLFSPFPLPPLKHKRCSPFTYPDPKPHATRFKYLSPHLAPHLGFELLAHIQIPDRMLRYWNICHLIWHSNFLAHLQMPNRMLRLTRFRNVISFGASFGTWNSRSTLHYYGTIGTWEVFQLLTCQPMHKYFFWNLGFSIIHVHQHLIWSLRKSTTAASPHPHFIGNLEIICVTWIQHPVLDLKFLVTTSISHLLALPTKASILCLDSL